MEIAISRDPGASRRFNASDTVEVAHRGFIIEWVQHHAITARGDDLGRFNTSEPALAALLAEKALR
jgi:hypothetical protein